MPPTRLPAVASGCLLACLAVPSSSPCVSGFSQSEDLPESSAADGGERIIDEVSHSQGVEYSGSCIHFLGLRDMTWCSWMCKCCGFSRRKYSTSNGVGDMYGAESGEWNVCMCVWVVKLKLIQDVAELVVNPLLLIRSTHIPHRVSFPTSSHDSSHNAECNSRCV